MVKWFLQIWRNLMNVTNVTSSNCHRSIYHGRSFSKVFSRKSGFTFTVDLDPKILRKLNIRILQVYICQWLIANRLCRSTNLTTIGILHNFRNSRNSQSIKKIFLKPSNIQQAGTNYHKTRYFSFSNVFTI